MSSMIKLLIINNDFIDDLVERDGEKLFKKLKNKMVITFIFSIVKVRNILRQP